MENERLARVEEKCSRIPIIEQKLDRLSERFNIGFGKILGACSANGTGGWSGGSGAAGKIIVRAFYQ